MNYTYHLNLLLKGFKWLEYSDAFNSESDARKFAMTLASTKGAPVKRGDLVAWQILPRFIPSSH